MLFQLFASSREDTPVLVVLKGVVKGLIWQVDDTDDITGTWIEAEASVWMGLRNQCFCHECSSWAVGIASWIRSRPMCCSVVAFRL